MVYSPLLGSWLKRLQKIEFAAASFVWADRYVNDTGDILKLNWLPVEKRMNFNLLKLTFKALHARQWLAPCKGIRIPESGKFLHVESGILETFARGIRNPGPWNPEYSCQNPESP